MPQPSPTSPLRIGITGHRFLIDEAEVKQKIKEVIESIMAQGSYQEFIGITCLARGADTLFADVVLNELHAPLRTILPFAIDDYEEDMGDEMHRLQFHELLNHDHNEIVVLNNLPLLHEEDRLNAYEMAGRELVDCVDILLAVWDGQPARGVGGTADIIACAESSNKQVIIIPANRSTER